MNLAVKIEVDTATPALRQMLDMLGEEGRGEIVGAMGRRVVRDTSRHVSQWGLSHPNKLGGRRTNYWSGIAAKINPADTLQVDGSTATMTLGGPEMPGITRAFGEVTIVPGTKTPGAKYIPVPANASAYGLRPREIAGLVLFWKGKGQVGGLAQGVAVTRTKNTRKGPKGSKYFRPGLIMFWFADRVTQPQDRSILPSDQQWSDSANAGAAEWVNLQLKKLN